MLPDEGAQVVPEETSENYGVKLTEDELRRLKEKMPEEFFGEPEWNIKVQLGIIVKNSK